MNIVEKIRKNKYNIDYHLEEGHGAGVNITPIGFLTVITAENGENTTPRFIPVEHKCSVDKLLDYIPDLFDKLNDSIKKAKERINEEETKKIKKEKIKVKEKEEPKETYQFEYEEVKPEEDD